MQISLAKAMKYKNRLVQRVRHIERVVNNENSHLAGSESEVDVRELLGKRNELVDALIDVKTRINEANGSIQADIYRKDELKAKSSFLRSIDTRHGKSLDSYRATEPQEYEATVRQKEIDEEILRIQAGIDNIQDRLDAVNQEVKVEVEVINLTTF